MFKAMVIGSMLVSSLAVPASASASARTASPPDKIVIDVVTANGSGCPNGTATVAVSPDNTAFTVTYSNYLAQVGVGAAPTDFRKNCQLGLNVHIPQGFTYAIAGADYRGFAHLEHGATGSETASYYFQGEPHTARISHPFTGWLDGDWQKTDTVSVAALVYEPCGEERNLNINTELRVHAGWSHPKSATSFLTMDSTDGNIATVYHVAWKRC
jgi:hypothetical protein